MGSNVSAEPKASVQVTLEDLELPSRREPPPPATSVSPLLGATTAAAPAKVQAVEELLPGGEAKGQRAFQEDGLVGTERQQLQLLAHYAELCEDFRYYQRLTRGEPQVSEGATLVLLSGPPGTGKTRHAVSFAKALGLPLLMPKELPWPQIRTEITGRDCILFLDEIDHYGEGFTSGLRQFLDGVLQPRKGKVLVLGTTNRLQELPRDLRHRAELVRFDRPETQSLTEMWRQNAQHLKEGELLSLAEVSEQEKATGRDVKHCASLCEREMAIAYLNEQRALGYCHGAALSNCPGPPLQSYIRCVRSRSE